MTWYLLLLVALPYVLRFLKWITLLAFAAYVLGKTGDSNSLRDVGAMLKPLQPRSIWHRGSAEGGTAELPPDTS